MYKYVRTLPTGFGDRIGAYLCLSAYGYAMGATTWTQKSYGRLHEQQCSDFDLICIYVTFPDNLQFVSSSELASLDYPEINWTDGPLAATYANDCLPTLAHLTFSHPLIHSSF